MEKERRKQRRRKLQKRRSWLFKVVEPSQLAIDIKLMEQCPETKAYAVALAQLEHKYVSLEFVPIDDLTPSQPPSKQAMRSKARSGSTYGTTTYDAKKKTWRYVERPFYSKKVEDVTKTNSYTTNSFVAVWQNGVKVIRLAMPRDIGEAMGLDEHFDWSESPIQLTDSLGRKFVANVVYWQCEAAKLNIAELIATLSDYMDSHRVNNWIKKLPKLVD